MVIGKERKYGIFLTLTCMACYLSDEWCRLKYKVDFSHFSDLWAAACTVAPWIAYASLVVIRCVQGVGCWILTKLAFAIVAALLEVALNIAAASSWERTLIFATQITQVGCWDREFTKEVLVVVSAVSGLCVSAARATFDSTVNDVDCCAKTPLNSSWRIGRVWSVLAYNDIVHTWLRALRGHVEP